MWRSRDESGVGMRWLKGRVDSRYTLEFVVLFCSSRHNAVYDSSFNAASPSCLVSHSTVLLWYMSLSGSSHPNSRRRQHAIVADILLRNSGFGSVMAHVLAIRDPLWKKMTQYLTLQRFLPRNSTPYLYTLIVLGLVRASKIHRTCMKR